MRVIALRLFTWEKIEKNGRVYRLNQEGVAVVNYSPNDGFATNLKTYIIVMTKYGDKTGTLPNYDTTELDTVTVNHYATRLIVGKKYFKCIYVASK